MKTDSICKNVWPNGFTCQKYRNYRGHWKKIIKKAVSSRLPAPPITIERHGSEFNRERRKTAICLALIPSETFCFLQKRPFKGAKQIQVRTIGIRERNSRRTFPLQFPATHFAVVLANSLAIARIHTAYFMFAFVSAHWIRTTSKMRDLLYTCITGALYTQRPVTC